MSLLTLIQGAASSLSLPAITAIVGSSEANSALLLTLAKREGRELMRRHDWQAIIADHNFPSVAALAQVGSVPSDYDRMLPYTKLWNVTTDQSYTFVSSDVWQEITIRSIGSGSPGYWILRGNTIYISPAPTAAETIDYNYVSKNYCESSGGTGQSDWAADSDLGRVPEHLVELGVTWRWLRAKGMDYAEELATYEREVEKAAARDKGIIGAAVISPNYGDDISRTWQGTITEV